MEETIPDPTRLEVQKALADTWRAWGGWSAVESGMINMTGMLADRMIELFASAKDRAILAERERCAKVADRCLADIDANPHDFGQLDTGGRRACEKIATSIRSGV